jgi:methylase of polypeptide subunit release factors
VVSSDAALVELLHRLKSLDYRFTAVTPLTHARVLARPCSGPATLRDIFGWNRSFARDDLDRGLLDLLDQADALQVDDNRLRSRFRVASLGEDLLLHSAFPTDSADAVFFGPDTYRFARFIEEQLPRIACLRRVVDMGAGSGAGGIVCSRLHAGAGIVLVDVNPAALRLARINAEAAGVDAECVRSDQIPTGTDLVVANPPYIIDPAKRTYRDGGGLFGGGVALDWTRQALDALATGGTLLLYTGAAVVDGKAPLIEAIEHACADRSASFDVEELDPDVFGEELETPRYANVERIAAVGIRITV